MIINNFLYNNKLVYEARLFFVVVFCMIIIAGSLFAQPKGLSFNSYKTKQIWQELRRFDSGIAEKLHLTDYTNVNSKSKYISIKTDTSTLALHFRCEDNLVNHIGIALFPPKLDSSVTTLLDFVERYMLELLLHPKLAMSQTESDKVSILLNGIPFGSPLFRDINTIVPKIETYRDFFVSLSGYFYTILFVSPKDEITLRFPASQELITGLDKRDLDRNLLVELLSHQTFLENKIVSDQEEELEVTSVEDSLFPGFVSTLRFDPDTRQLLFDKNSVVESLVNFCLAPSRLCDSVTFSFKVKIPEVHRMTMDFFQIRNYFSRDYKSYVGIEKIADNSYKITLIQKHKNYNNIHMLFFELDPAILFQNTPVSLNGKFYLNIRHDNIKNLFAKEFEKPENNLYKINIKQDKKTDEN